MLPGGGGVLGDGVGVRQELGGGAAVEDSVAARNSPGVQGLGVDKPIHSWHLETKSNLVNN